VAEHSPDRHTIAVTGVGALIGQGIARSLRPAGRARIVGIDRRITPFSQSFCDICEQKPEADEASEAYLDFWRNLVRTHSIDLILPGSASTWNSSTHIVLPLTRWACRLP
jgi:carbamoyl-phosphate synthase large subunit